MSTGTIAATVGVVIIVLIVGFFAFRPSTTEAPTPTPSPAFEDVDSSPQLSVTETDSEDEATAETEDSDASSDVATTSETVTISVDENGFSPSTVTIAAGTTVTFVNNGQGPHWPASAIHPTHQTLPGFDSLRGLTTGETYSHTFTEVGTWPMHDHLRPSSTGTITVE